MTELDPKTLRRAFGSFMTGVTIVSTLDPEGKPVGFTANSFTSVSLDPPLLLVCPGKFLSSYDSFVACGHFCVNVLAEGQEDASNTFASYKGDRFAKVPHQLNDHGVPLIDGALAQFSCVTHQVVPAGDHALLMGRVESVNYTEGRGLGYANGGYFSLGLEREALEQSSGPVVCGAILEVNDHVLLEETPQGYRPPQIERANRGQLRAELASDLGGRGLQADLGAAYSVFDDANTHYAYFLATASHSDLGGAIKAIPIADLPKLTYTRRSIADMMARFSIEFRSRSFALYVGDAQNGDVHTL